MMKKKNLPWVVLVEYASVIDIFALKQEIIQVQKWQVRNGETWKDNDSIRIKIRRNKKVF